MTMGVYAIRNKINKKTYVGSSVDIEKRFKKHIRELNNNSHHSYKLQDAWNYAGRNKNIFQLIILEKVDYKSQLKRKEQEYIYSEKAYQYGYNCSDFAVNLYYTKNYNIKKDMQKQEGDEDKYFLLFHNSFQYARNYNCIFFNKQLVFEIDNCDQYGEEDGYDESTYHFLWTVIEYFCVMYEGLDYSLSIWLNGASITKGIFNNSNDNRLSEIVDLGLIFDKNKEEIIELFENNSFDNYYKMHGGK